MKERKELEDMTEEEREELKKQLISEPQLQGLVQAPQFNNIPAMLYGPPNAPGPGFFQNNSPSFGMMMINRAYKWIDDETWMCTCGTVNSGKFCSECGTAAPTKPATWISEDKWQCTCGMENSGKFCSECGAKAPDKKDGSDKQKWTCECGNENTGRYCTECGKIKPADKSDTWKCPNCNAENLGKFCKECGTPRSQQ